MPVNEQAEHCGQSIHKNQAPYEIMLLFPYKLHKLLEDAEANGMEDIISFYPCGKAFAIHKPIEFVNKIMHRYFRTTRLESFNRQLLLYGFKRFKAFERSKAGYHHEWFVKGEKSLLPNIRRNLQCFPRDVKCTSPFAGQGSKLSNKRSPVAYRHVMDSSRDYRCSVQNMQVSMLNTWKSESTQASLPIHRSRIVTGQQQTAYQDEPDASFMMASSLDLGELLTGRRLSHLTTSASTGVPDSSVLGYDLSRNAQCQIEKTRSNMVLNREYLPPIQRLNPAHQPKPANAFTTLVQLLSGDTAEYHGPSNLLASVPQSSASRGVESASLPLHSLMLSALYKNSSNQELLLQPSHNNSRSTIQAAMPLSFLPSSLGSSLSIGAINQMTMLNINSAANALFEEETQRRHSVTSLKINLVNRLLAAKRHRLPP